MLTLKSSIFNLSCVTHDILAQWLRTETKQILNLPIQVLLTERKDLFLNIEMNVSWILGGIWVFRKDAIGTRNKNSKKLEKRLFN